VRPGVVDVLNQEVAARQRADRMRGEEPMHVGIATDCALKDDLIALLRAAGDKGASICANGIPGVRAGLIHDHFAAVQGVEDDHMNVICIGGRTVGPGVAWDLVQAFVAAEFSHAPRHLRRLSKVARLELETARENR
jgi:RpiB/LacA/LacB family sugar-phosphate isomerase